MLNQPVVKLRYDLVGVRKQVANMGDGQLTKIVFGAELVNVERLKRGHDRGRVAST